MKAMQTQQYDNYRVRLQQLPRRVWFGYEQVRFDDTWHVNAGISEGEIVLSNIHTHHRVTLSADQIRRFIPDPSRETDGFRHGVFELRVVLTFENGQLRSKPMSEFNWRDVAHVALPNSRRQLTVFQ